MITFLVDIIEGYCKIMNVMFLLMVGVMFLFIAFLVSCSLLKLMFFSDSFIMTIANIINKR